MRERGYPSLLLPHLSLFLKEVVMSLKEVQAETAAPAAPKPTTGPVVKFDDTGITNAYANV
jgi:hypothetical protein